VKILNLYAGIGGNRKLWPNVWGGAKVEVTAVEINPEIAKIYSDFFPNDKVIVGDAHQYLLDHYKEFDFIWSSPPCPSHSRARYWSSKGGLLEPIYPDMKLWQEIIFLQSFVENNWVVENVVSYYPKFLDPIQSGNHYFWSNFAIVDYEDAARKTDIITTKTKHYGYNLENTKIENKIQILRNLVNPKLGLHIFNEAFKVKQKTLV